MNAKNRINSFHNKMPTEKSPTIRKNMIDELLKPLDSSKPYKYYVFHFADKSSQIYKINKKESMKEQIKESIEKAHKKNHGTIPEYVELAYYLEGSNNENLILFTQVYKDYYEALNDLVNFLIKTKEGNFNQLTYDTHFSKFMEISNNIIKKEKEKEKQNEIYTKNFVDFFSIAIVNILKEYISSKTIDRGLILYTLENMKRVKEKLIDQVKEKLQELFLNNLEKLNAIVISHAKEYYEYLMRQIKTIPTYTYDRLGEAIDPSLAEFFIAAMLSAKVDNDRSEEIDVTMHIILEDRGLLLMSILTNTTTVKKLNLNNNKIQVPGLYGLGRLYKFNNTLIDVDLQFNNLNEACLEAFKNGLENGKTALVRLNLSNNPKISKECGKLVAFIIERSPALEHINLTKTELETGWVLIFLKIIELYTHSSCKITHIVAMQSKLEERGLAACAKALLHENCQIKSLSLSDNSLNNNGGRKLFESFKQNNTIEEFIAYNCDIGVDNSLVDLVYDAIFLNSSFIIVSIYNNKITDKAKLLKIISLARGDSEYMGRLNRIKHLDVSKNLSENSKFNVFESELCEIVRNLDTEVIDISQNVNTATKDDDIAKAVVECIEKRDVKIYY
jgi:hypothetical protein